MKCTLPTFVALALLAFGTSHSQAQIIGIDFNNGGAVNQSPGSSAVVGPYASAGWYNNVDVSTNPGPGSISLYDNTDTATGATVGFTDYPNNTLQGRPIYSPSFPATGSANAGLTADQQLYNGAATTGAFGNTAGQEVVLQNIPYAHYSVYVLVDALNIGTAADEVQNFNGGLVGGAGTPVYLTASPGLQAGITSLPSFPGYVQATGTTTGTATSGADYVLFSGLTSANQAIDIQDWTAVNGGAPYDSGFAISGVEIVDNATPLATPEPSTYALLLVGIGMLVVVARRRMPIL